MTTHRTGSPFSYARFASAEHVCVACQEFGKREYEATFAGHISVRCSGLDPMNPISIPPCDVCEQRLRFIEAVTVTMPPFAETPHGIREYANAAFDTKAALAEVDH